MVQERQTDKFIFIGLFLLYYNNNFKSLEALPCYFQERLQMLEINYRRITEILKISFLGIYFAHSWIGFQCLMSALCGCIRVIRIALNCTTTPRPRGYCKKKEKKTLQLCNWTCCCSRLVFFTPYLRLWPTVPCGASPAALYYTIQIWDELIAPTRRPQDVEILILISTRI